MSTRRRLNRFWIRSRNVSCPLQRRSLLWLVQQMVTLSHGDLSPIRVGGCSEPAVGILPYSNFIPDIDHCPSTPRKGTISLLESSREDWHCLCQLHRRSGHQYTSILDPQSYRQHGSCNRTLTYWFAKPSSPPPYHHSTPNRPTD